METFRTFALFSKRKKCVICKCCIIGKR
ncbi:hypothetical protein PP915_gp06 [Staphylococcus phage JPL-50]|uniref:Uncharacterized protein n=1 Tax=Staphylococcus phage JPL-50 TaxID=2851077 RepID=A0A8F3HM99_9CAUD|nr:hypothetical protein PP915_gp06 [Staphylococcus phage JPL-50]QWY14487.1 hypothetical protein [Staphylococcus phage JPL-50]